jgi:hypothetical protein
MFFCNENDPLNRFIHSKIQNYVFFCLKIAHQKENNNFEKITLMTLLVGHYKNMTGHLQGLAIFGETILEFPTYGCTAIIKPQDTDCTL